MKALLISLGMICLISQNALAQKDIKGVWWAEKDKVKVEIYEKSPGELAGKIVWLAEPNDKKGNPHLDRKNPDRSLRSRPLMGIEMLENIHQEEGDWRATIYSPKRGRRIDGMITLSQSNELKIKVSVMGMSRTQTWARAAE